jgi:hypothetical protein
VDEEDGIPTLILEGREKLGDDGMVWDCEAPMGLESEVGWEGPAWCVLDVAMIGSVKNWCGVGQLFAISCGGVVGGDGSCIKECAIVHVCTKASGLFGNLIVQPAIDKVHMHPTATTSQF